MFQTMPVRHARKIVYASCKGNHCAYSRECPRCKLEQRVEQVRVQNKLSFTEARKLVEMPTPTAVGNSYVVVSAPKLSTKNVVINTELTWHFDDEKKKIV